MEGDVLVPDVEMRKESLGSMPGVSVRQGSSRRDVPLSIRESQ
jgi:hypothetical protein